MFGGTRQQQALQVYVHDVYDDVNGGEMIQSLAPVLVIVIPSTGRTGCSRKQDVRLWPLVSRLGAPCRPPNCNHHDSWSHALTSVCRGGVGCGVLGSDV